MRAQRSSVWPVDAEGLSRDVLHLRMMIGEEDERPLMPGLGRNEVPRGMSPLRHRLVALTETPRKRSHRTTVEQILDGDLGWISLIGRRTVARKNEPRPRAQSPALGKRKPLGAARPVPRPGPSAVLQFMRRVQRAIDNCLQLQPSTGPHRVRPRRDIGRHKAVLGGPRRITPGRRPARRPPIHTWASHARSELVDERSDLPTHPNDLQSSRHP